MRIIIFGLFFSLFLPSAYADDIYDKCLQDNIHDRNTDNLICGIKYVERVDKLLNQTWNEIYSSHDNDPNHAIIKKLILDEQRSWIAFKDASCSYYDLGYNGVQGQAVNSNTCLGRIIENRITELNRFYRKEPDASFLSNQYMVDLKTTDRDFNRTYQVLMQSLKNIREEAVGPDLAKNNPPPKDTIRNEQRKWLDFKQKACLFFTNSDKDDTQGLYQNCIDQITRHRQDQLAHYCDEAECNLSERPPSFISADNWTIGCDQSFTCTAIGNIHQNDDSSYTTYIRIRWQYHSPKPPEIRIVMGLGNEGYETKYDMQFHFDDNLYQQNTASLMNTPGKDTYPSDVYVNPAEANAFFQALLKSKKLNYSRTNQPKTEIILPLEQFTSFYTNTQYYVDALFPNQIASLPTLKAYELSFNYNSGPTPKNFKIKPDEDDCNHDVVTDVAFESTNGDKFYAVCNISGLYNEAYAIYQLTKNNSIKSAQFDGDPHNSNPFSGEKNDMEIEDFMYERGIGDCGTQSKYAYDGRKFRLSKVTTMPYCNNVDIADWPVLYRSNVEKIQPN